MGRYNPEILKSLNITDTVWGNEVRVLNYSQINSPKFHPIVRECRGLITDLNYNIVSRPFDRFFNYGEIDYKFNNSSFYRFYDKIDGTLIKIYYYNSSWRVSTRSNPYADQPASPSCQSPTFKELVFGVLPIQDCEKLLDKSYTYLFELTSRYNKIVIDYGDYPKLWYLISRNNNTGLYYSHKEELLSTHCSFPNEYSFEGIDKLLLFAKSLSNFQEGFVLYENFTPVLKIKNPNYVIAHQLRGKSVLTLNNAIKLFVSKEHEEYLSYFPEDNYLFDILELFYNNFIDSVQQIYDLTQELKLTKKDVGLSNVDNLTKSIVFKAMDQGDSVDCHLLFTSFDPEKQISLLSKLPIQSFLSKYFSANL